MPLLQFLDCGRGLVVCHEGWVVVSISMVGFEVFVVDELGPAVIVGVEAGFLGRM